MKMWMKQFMRRTWQIIQIQVVSQARRRTRPSMYVFCSPSRPVLRPRLTPFSIKKKYYEEFHETRVRSLLHQDYCLCYLCALVVTTWRTLCALVLTTWKTFELLLLHEDPSDHPKIQVGTRLKWHDDPTLPVTSAALYWKTTRYMKTDMFSPVMTTLEPNIILTWIFLCCMKTPIST